MSQSPTVPSRLPESGSLDPDRSSPQGKCSSPCISQSRQFLACTSATLTMVIVGTVYGWTTTSLLHLLTGTAGVPLRIRRAEYSWMISITVIGSIVGSFVAAQLADRQGRRYCLLICSTIFSVGWYVSYEATSVQMLYFARLFLGIGVGIARTITPMYVSEVADINIRGSLGTLIAVDVYTGTLLTCALGIWLTYNSLLLLLVVISFISFFPNTCFPETPYFLVAKGLKEEACKSIAYYKNIVDPHRVEIELHAIRAQARYELHPQSRCELNQQSRNDLHSQSTNEIRRPSTSQIHPETTSEIHVSSTAEIHRRSTSDIHPGTTSEIHPGTRSELQSRSRSDLCTQFNVDSQGTTDIDEIYMDGTKYTCITKLQVILHRNYRKALYIMLGLTMAKQLSGNFITRQYLEVLFSKITIVIDPDEAMILVQFVSFASGSLIFFAVQIVGRRTLLLLSTGGTCITLIILAIYLLLVGNLLGVSNVSIVPVIDLIIYQVVFEIGLGTLSNVLLCELFPTELKGFVGAINVAFDGLIGLIVSLLYLVFEDPVASYTIYFIFATSCFLAFLMVFIWVPETKGKTYNEIKALLAGENLNSLNEEVKTDEMDIRRF